MLVKAASHLRPILRLQGLLTNSHSAAATTTTTTTTATSATSATSSAFGPSTTQAFTSNATLLTQAQVQAGQAQIATIQQNGGNFVGAAWGLGNAGGAGAGSGPGAGNGAGSKFPGYTGFGRTLTQAPQSQSTTQQAQDGEDDLVERDALTLSDIRSRRPSTLARSKSTRRRSSSRVKSTNGLDLPPSPTSASQQVEIIETSVDDTTTSDVRDRSLREDESAVEDPDSDVEWVTRREHRLHRRRASGREDALPIVGTWTVGLRGGKFVRLPTRLSGLSSSRTRTFSSQSEGRGRTVDDLEMNASRRVGLQRMRIISQGRGVNGVDRPRRNSYSASTSSTSAVRSDDRSTGKPVNRGELGLAESELREELQRRDEGKWEQMIQAVRNGQREKALRLAEEYRNPAALHSDPKISSGADVEPPFFTQSGYNAVIEILHRYRRVGEPITQILKAYNEMLERDVLPNIRTYSFVIRSLMERHNEVQAAVAESAAKRKWIEWDKRHARSIRKDGTGGADYQFQERDRSLQPVEEQIAALKKERNYENAIKLFQSGVTYNRHRPFQLAVYALLMGAAASRGDLETITTVWSHLEGVRNTDKKTQSVDGQSLVILYAHLVECYSKSPEGGVEGMQDVLKRFLLDEKNGKIRDGRKRNGFGEPGPDKTKAEAAAFGEATDIMRGVAAFFDSLLKGYTKLGEDDKVQSLLQLMRSTTDEEERRAGHLIRVNASAIFNIAEALFDRGQWQRAIEFISEQQSEMNLSSMQRTARLLGYKALNDDNIEAILAISSLGRPGDLTFDLVFIRRAVIQLVAKLQQPEIAPELAERIIFAVDRLTSSWPSTEKWNIDSLTVGSFVEKAGQFHHPEQAYNLLRLISKHSEFTGIIIASNTGSLLNGIYRQADTLRKRLEVMHVTDSSKQAQPREFAREMVPELVAELPTDPAAMQAWADESERETLSTIVRALARVGGAVVSPLKGDQSVDFDQQSEEIIRRLSVVQGDHAMDRSSLLVAASLVQQRRGKQYAKTFLESCFGTEVAADLLDRTDSSSDISAALSDIPSPSSSDSASQASTLPTEHSAETDVRQYRPAHNGIARQIDQHLGMRPARTPIEAYAILKKCEAEGELPHPAVIARLTTSMARLGLADKVAELYQYAHASLANLSDERRLDAWYTIEDHMLMACCLLGRLEQAGLHRAAILEQNRVPTAEAYALMISSAKDTTDDASVARELWEESQNLGVVPTLFLYNTIISKLSRARKAEVALEFFKKMKAQGIRPSSVTYGAVINACCRVGDAESAATLFEEMQSIPNHKPRVPPYNTMMQLHLQSHPSRELVLHYYNQMVQANVAPSAHTYKLLLDAYGTLEPVDLSAMQTVFNNLCNDSRVSVAGTHWASMIHATGNVAGNAQDAVDMFESIPTHPSNKRGGPIEPVCWEALMSVLAQHKMVTEMESYRARMTEQGIRATAYVYNMLIKGYGNVGQIENSRAVFESMGDSGIGKAAPNNHPTLLTSSGQVKPATTADTTVVFREPSTYETMIRAELQAGNKDAAQAICDRMEARMYPIAVTSRIRSLVDDVAPAGPM